MMNQKGNNVTWDDYLDHLRALLKELMVNDEFSDVTLVTEDKKNMSKDIKIF